MEINRAIRLYSIVLELENVVLGRDQTHARYIHSLLSYLFGPKTVGFLHSSKWPEYVGKCYQKWCKNSNASPFNQIFVLLYKIWGSTWYRLRLCANDSLWQCIYGCQVTLTYPGTCFHITKHLTGMLGVQRMLTNLKLLPREEQEFKTRYFLNWHVNWGIRLSLLYETLRIPWLIK